MSMQGNARGGGWPVEVRARGPFETARMSRSRLEALLHATCPSDDETADGLERGDADEVVLPLVTRRRPRPRPTLVVSSPAGEVRSAVASGERVAEERSFETMYREEREANRLKDDFLASVSHELRTPLNAVLGWARMLSGGGLSKEKAAHALEVIERNALCQAQLIEDLLDTSRIVSGTLRLTMTTYALEDVLVAAVDSVRPAIDAKGIRLDCDLAGARRPLQGDPERLQQVFWNLLVNATKFSVRGGRIRISADDRGDSVVLAIKDDGKGISAAFLPHVFDRFAQADSATTRRASGLGLGLSLARSLVELHGGTIAVDSAGEGHGSTFTVVLPASAEMAVR